MKAVIFDHDGTLVDSEGTHHTIWDSVLRPWGIHFPLEEYIALHSGVPTLQNAQRLFNTYAIPLDNYQTLFSIKENATAAYLANKAFPLLPYVREILTACQQQSLPIGLATGASNAEVTSTLSQHKLTPYFASVATRERVQNCKPAPDVYTLAATELGIPPQECIAIEDSNSGVISAKAAGIYCIAIPNAYSAGHDLSAANIVLPNLEAAYQHILTLTT